MSWTKHIQEVINKASKALNFVKRTLYQCEPSVKVAAYITLVRPILEYANIVWDPHQQYLIDITLKWYNGEQLGGLKINK